MTFFCNIPLGRIPNFFDRFIQHIESIFWLIEFPTWYIYTPISINKNTLPYPTFIIYTSTVLYDLFKILWSYHYLWTGMLLSIIQNTLTYSYYGFSIREQGVWYISSIFNESK